MKITRFIVQGNNPKIRSIFVGLHKMKLNFETMLRYPGDIFGHNKVPVFHHIPKCGGSSLLSLLNHWFIVKHDYFILPNDRNETINDYKLKREKLGRLRNIHCLAGHFSDDDVPLFERYPELCKDGRFFIFTFLRDPFDVKVSHYYYLKKLGKSIVNQYSLSEFIMENPNYLARKLNVNESNYKEILDRYNFIGFIENAQRDLDLLSNKLGRDTLEMLKINTSKRDFQQSDLSPSLIEDFKSSNLLDYKIYSYARSRFEEKIS